MRKSLKIRAALLSLILYLVFCVVGGSFIADGTLHPPRRPLTDTDVSAVKNSLEARGGTLDDVSLTVRDGAVLRAWVIHPRRANGDAAILLHGLGDNRLGMIGYAQLLTAHGYTVLLPDARAHGISGGNLATYGLLEKNDIREWLLFLAHREHPRCIFGFGESMGAAELLQSLQAGAPFCAVAAESSFANFREIAYDRMGQPFHLGPWVGRTFLRPLVEVAFLRARWKYGLNMEKVSPEESVAETTVPVLLIHGEVDHNIPVRHSQLIHERAPATELWQVPGADHCGAVDAAPVEFEHRVLGWFSTHDTLPAGTAAR
jgi:uncharacterized protein